MTVLTELIELKAFLLSGDAASSDFNSRLPCAKFKE